MPKRDDITSVLVIGSGPIVIGQAAEFDYSGTQACRVLRAEGVRVILVNSNPATIMTDPDFADATYIEPITSAVLESIIIKERPDAVLPTLGGQTALNAAIELDRLGILAKHGVELIKTAQEGGPAAGASPSGPVDPSRSAAVGSTDLPTGPSTGSGSTDERPAGGTSANAETTNQQESN